MGRLLHASHQGPWLLSCFLLFWYFLKKENYKSFLNTLCIRYLKLFCRGTFTPSPFSKNRKYHILFWNGNQSLESPKMGNLCKMKDGSSSLQYALTKGENIFFVTWIFIQISTLSCTLPNEQRCQEKKRLVGDTGKHELTILTPIPCSARKTTNLLITENYQKILRHDLI